MIVAKPLSYVVVFVPWSSVELLGFSSTAIVYAVIGVASAL